tara:strand:- start:280 stop:543 length:264 start_codon:yes stop_codon:yes gene_type:complete
MSNTIITATSASFVARDLGRYNEFAEAYELENGTSATNRQSNGGWTFYNSKHIAIIPAEFVALASDEDLDEVDREYYEDQVAAANGR